MRIALVGWDFDDAGAAELARLGAEVVGLTRWFPDRPAREHREGWTKLCCPHQIGGSARDEASALAVAMVRDASTSGIGFDYDVIHATDRLARPAARALAERSGDAVLAATVGDVAADLADEGGDGLAGFDGWICGHPWVAERVRGVRGTSAWIAVVPGAREVEAIGAAHAEVWPSDLPEGGPRLVISLAEPARAWPRVVIAGVRHARESVPGLVVTVFGVGARADRLRGRLARAGLACESAPGSAAASVALWNHAVVHAAAVGIDAPAIAEDPRAWLAWLAGRPVIRVWTHNAERLGRAIRDALFHTGRRDRDVEAGAALARRQFTPSAVAAGWLKAYLELLARKHGPPWPAAPRSEPAPPRPFGLPELRSRLHLTPLSPHEVLASWKLRPDDLATAQEWMGPEAVRAVLSLRFHDATALHFNGLNAHDVWDVDLDFAEGHRVIPLKYDGRSLAACLGLRTRWGYFHPLAHARICHLPRASPTSTPAGRRLRILGGGRGG